MKLGINDLYRNTNNIIEAFFDIPPQSRDMGPPEGHSQRALGGPKIFFQFFKFLLFQGLPMDHSFTKKLFLAAKSELFVCWREEKGFISV